MEASSKLSQFSNAIIGESTLAIPEGAADRFPGAAPGRSERRLVPAAKHNSTIGCAPAGAPELQREHTHIVQPVALQRGQVYVGGTAHRRQIAERQVPAASVVRTAGSSGRLSRGDTVSCAACVQRRPAGWPLAAWSGTTSCNGAPAGGSASGEGGGGVRGLGMRASLVGVAP